MSSFSSFIDKIQHKHIMKSSIVLVIIKRSQIMLSKIQRTTIQPYKHPVYLIFKFMTVRTSMLSGVCLGTNNIKASGDFYDAVLATIGMTCVLSEPNERGYAGIDGKMTFFILSPFNEQKATFGNGTQVMFFAPNKDAVDAFHSTVLQNGGVDEGAPGPRHYHPDYYGAYARDLDGNKLNISVELKK